MERAGDAQGRCNSIYAWPSTGCNSINASSWNSIYVGCQPSTCCNSTKRRYSKEVERHARGRSHGKVEGEACHSDSETYYPAAMGARQALDWTKGCPGPDDAASMETTTNASNRFGPALPHVNNGG